ncbi:hypothetical protein ACFSJS_22655 [Streptomyces desertarenae]|uniref:Uncharacterized protein n=1 Tax=Streptomyces desertarenae TaxID=2666184 RepID=A0ABW4PQM2_9ACTN
MHTTGLTHDRLVAQTPIGSYALVRIPERYLTGQADHTIVCRVTGHDLRGRVELLEIRTGDAHTARPEYVRPISPAEIMRDIDTAALDAGDLLGAGDVWLRRWHGAQPESVQ